MEILGSVIGWLLKLFLGMRSRPMDENPICDSTTGLKVLYDSEEDGPVEYELPADCKCHYGLWNSITGSHKPKYRGLLTLS
jgi:hypothetical protein